MYLLIVALLIAYATATSPEDIKKNAVAALEHAPLGTTPEKDHIGRDFYKHYFTKHPEVRKYFIGAESITPDEVDKSERFKKQGTRLLTAVHVLANTYDNDAVFRGFVRDLIHRHSDKRIDPKEWKAIWSSIESFLETRGTSLTAEQKAALEAIGNKFNEEAQKDLAAHGHPHV
uniref:GLOBIN domain-containing protein n=1 Tax=Haemonchus contortus TaxID=6289 RepID=A0A7I5EC57_HAECO